MCRRSTQIRYTRTELLGFATGHLPANKPLRAAIWTTRTLHGLCDRPPILRGTRAGTCKQRPITNVIRNKFSALQVKTEPTRPPLQCHLLKLRAAKRPIPACTPIMQTLSDDRVPVLVPLPRHKPNYDLPTVFLSSTRALTNTIDELGGILHTTDIDIAAITETWMSVHHYP